jgi:hypothetical protein
MEREREERERLKTTDKDKIAPPDRGRVSRLWSTLSLLLLLVFPVRLTKSNCRVVHHDDDLQKKKKNTHTHTQTTGMSMLAVSLLGERERERLRVI